MYMHIQCMYSVPLHQLPLSGSCTPDDGSRSVSGTVDDPGPSGAHAGSTACWPPGGRVSCTLRNKLLAYMYVYTQNACLYTYATCMLKYLINVEKMLDLTTTFSLCIEKPQLSHEIVDLFLVPILLATCWLYSITETRLHVGA